MNTQNLIFEIFEVCILPLLSILTVYAVKLINIKIAEISNDVKNEKAEKYIRMIGNTITSCVLTTNQTYVDTLKKQGKFDEKAQKVAFEKSYQAVITLLSEDAKAYITEVHGDLNKYLTNLIEAEVKLNK